MKFISFNYALVPVTCYGYVSTVCMRYFKYYYVNYGAIKEIDQLQYRCESIRLTNFD